MYTEEQVAAMKTEVVKLLMQGYTERAMNELGTVANHDTRWEWRKKDPVFSDQCKEARAIGSEIKLNKAEKVLGNVMEKVFDHFHAGSELTGPMVALLKENMQYFKWLATKHNPEIYADQTKVLQQLLDKAGMPADAPANTTKVNLLAALSQEQLDALLDDADT